MLILIHKLKPNAKGMEVKDLVAIVVAACGALWHYFKTEAKVDNVRTEANSKYDLLKNDLENHKASHRALEKRVTEHEDKIDERLTKMDSKIDSNHKETTESLTKLLIAVEGLKK